MLLKYLIPFFDPYVGNWALEARLLRWLTFLWLFIGLAVLFSASYPVAEAELGEGLYYFKRQLLWALLGVVGFNVVVRSPLRYALKIAPWMVILLLIAILATQIPGVGIEVNGATRWIAVGPFPLQPSELIKPFLVVQAACLFGKWKRLSWGIRAGWLGIFSAVLVGILLQPNLSNTALCGTSFWLIALAAGLPLKYLAGTASLGLFAAAISINSNSYQLNRVTLFLHPWADPQGDSYQLVQSLLAVGSGGTWGTGFGLSQQKLAYLPIQHTDFIFAVFAEEFGLVGSLLLLLLLMTYATLALLVAIQSRRAECQLVAMGAMIFLVGQSLINVGVAIGALPTTGLPLPLFSYGGNSIIASLLLAGLLVRVARESQEAEVVSLRGRRRSVPRS